MQTWAWGAQLQHAMPRQVVRRRRITMNLKVARRAAQDIVHAHDGKDDDIGIPMIVLLHDAAERDDFMPASIAALPEILRAVRERWRFRDGPQRVYEVPIQFGLSK